MRELNRTAAEALAALDPTTVHAVTDVTGFGLFGHGWEMAERSAAVLRFDRDALPLYDGALTAAEAGTRTGGDVRNRAHLEGRVVVGPSVGVAREALCYDPQTSGGLLAAVDRSAVDVLAAPGFVVIGDVVEGPAGVELS